MKCDNCGYETDNKKSMANHRRFGCHHGEAGYNKRHQWNIYQRQWRRDNSVKSREYGRKSQRRARIECISHYSDSKNVCACCGESHLEFLCIDHIDGGGSKVRRQQGSGSIYWWLRARKYPEGFRVLCHNCNMSLGFYGYCPHKEVPNEGAID